MFGLVVPLLRWFGLVFLWCGVLRLCCIVYLFAVGLRWWFDLVVVYFVCGFWLTRWKFVGWECLRRGLLFLVVVCCI